MSVDLSIIVPVYNCEKYVAECLDSILNQKSDSYEIICVNDGSTDMSLSILQRYERDNPNCIKVISQKNKGSSAARNEGVRMSSGKYLWFVDSDDKLPNENVVGTMIREMNESNLDVLYFELDGYYENDEVRKKRQDVVENLKLRREYGQYGKGYDFFCDLQKNGLMVICAVCSCVRREVLEKNRISFLEGYSHEDVLYNFQLMLSADRVKHINKVFYLYNQHGGGSISSNVDFSHFVALYAVLNEMTLFSSKHKWPSYVDSMIIRRLNRFKRWVSTLLVHVNTNILNECQCYLLEDLKATLKKSQEQTYIFPVYLFPQNAKIIIYGAGNVGQQFIKFLQSYDKLQLIGVIDKDSGRKVNGIEVKSLEQIKEVVFDYILISIENEQIARQVKRTLEKKEIRPECIKWAGKLYDEMNFMKWIHCAISEKYNVWMR